MNCRHCAFYVAEPTGETEVQLEAQMCPQCGMSLDQAHVPPHPPAPNVPPPPTVPPLPE